MTGQKAAHRRYRTIYADPPWPERGGGMIKRGADAHYDTLLVSEIMSLPVQDLAEDDAHLYLWVTNTFLPDGLGVLDAWGFRYVTTITWAKDKCGLGQYHRGQTEQCLFGVRGRLPYRFTAEGKRAQGSTLITAPVLAHSRKPEEMRRQVERVSYPPYLELFARRRAPGWDVWGYEAAGSIEMPSPKIGTRKPMR